MIAAGPSWTPVRRSTWRVWLRLARAALAALVVFAITPGSEGLVDAVGHLLHDGHLPHSEAHQAAEDDETCAEACGEHGCTAMSHHCSCCASAPALTPRSEAPARRPGRQVAEHRRALLLLAPPDHGPEPGLRPPIT